MPQLYRICRSIYKPEDPSGAFKTPGRWHTSGHSVIYFCSSLAMCILELKANSVSFTSIRKEYHYSAVEINESNFLINEVPKSLYTGNWTLNLKKTQDFGNEWYQSSGSPILKVKSAVLPVDYNYIVNTKHPDFPGIKFPRPANIPLDQRII